MKKRFLMLSVLLTLAAFGFCAWLYPGMPTSIPTHWNAAGMADGFSPRMAIFIYSAGMLATIAAWVTLPFLSPSRFTTDAFAPTWWQGGVMLVAFIGYLQCLHAWSAYSGGVDMGRAMLAGLALLFAFTGNVMGKVRRNFWFGVRTPWALANARVWYATHRMAARSMVAGAALALLLLLLRAPTGWAIGVLVASVLLPAAWSLLYYKRLERRGALES
ncbi:SdpI family protein [Massilia timonae]|uniref:DUF1648 domain-containing protein n=1 Tax=Massilia timonae TaxID=47229 RepID=A0A1S2NEW1_9BURK|nr:SdpI family protein [Massilia timonae]OIJ43588.1 hypothetical protein LO55_3038 [Massilia timonae]